MNTVHSGFHIIPVDKLHESPLNPRKRTDPAALQELAVSITAHGVLTPLLVRPNAKGFEIAAGHRRYRAAKLADLAEVPAVVREMTDTEFLEILVVENDQREDVHPLEQAAGYKALMLQDGYDAKRIADRIGRSEKWVYDRVKLLSLTPLAQQLFLAGKMSAGHAILIARLTKEQQERIIGTNDDSYDEIRLALFQSERSGEDLWDLTPAEQKAERTKDPLARYKGYKPVSVRELDGWINEHVRLDPTKVDPFLFPEVATAVEQAPKDLVPLTRESFIPEEARSKTRTWGPRAWKEVTDPKKACTYTQPGVIVVGPGRGEILQVCLSSHRDQCATHWSKESKEAEQARKATARPGGRGAARESGKKPAWQIEQTRREAEDAKRAALRGRYMKASPALFAALSRAIENASLSALAKPLLARLAPDQHARSLIKIAEYSEPGKTADSILRHLAFLDLLDDCGSEWRMVEGFTSAGKTWGLDVAAIVNKVAPAPAAEKKPEATKAPKTARTMGAIPRKKKAAKK